MPKTGNVHYGRGNSDANDKVEHMRSVEVELEYFILEIVEEVFFGFVRVLELVESIWHSHFAGSNNSPAFIWPFVPPWSLVSVGK